MKMVRQWRYLLLATLAIVALAALAACSSGDNTTSTPTSNASGSATPKASGPPADAAADAQQTLTMNLGAEPGTIDPQAQAYVHEATVVNGAYYTLFWQDPTTSQLTPRAAIEVPTQANGGISADSLTYTIKLNPDLMWSDGTPVTAADFVYGIERGFNLNVSGAGYGGFFTNLKGATAAGAEDAKAADYFTKVQADLAPGVSAVDDHTLKLVADHVSASFLANFVLPINSAVKKSNVEAVGASFGTPAGAGQMVSDGQFMIKEWVAGDHILLVRNPYFKVAHPSYLKELKFTFTADTNQAYTALQAGQAGESGVPPTSVDSVKTDPTFHQEPEFGMRWIYVDVTIPPWNNKDFVIAINQATDRQTIGTDVYKGVRAPLDAPCVPGVLACDVTIFDNLKFDLTKAKASAAKAYPTGTTIPEITLEVSNDPTTQSLAQTLQSQWQQIPGVKVNIVTTDQATLQADMKAHKSGTQISGWQMDYADASDLWVVWLSTDTGNNKGFWNRPDYDALEKKQDTQLDTAARSATLKQLQQYLAADPPAIFTFLQTRSDQFGSKVKGIVPSPFDFQIIGDNFLEELYISK